MIMLSIAIQTPDEEAVLIVIVFFHGWYSTVSFEEYTSTVSIFLSGSIWSKHWVGLWAEWTSSLFNSVLNPIHCLHHLLPPTKMLTVAFTNSFMDLL